MEDNNLSNANPGVPPMDTPTPAPAPEAPATPETPVVPETPAVPEAPATDPMDAQAPATAPMETPNANPAPATQANDGKNAIRFVLTFFLGWIGSFIINHTSLKPAGYKCRTAAYFFLTIITFGIYALVASICNFTFDPNKPKNIGYAKE